MAKTLLLLSGVLNGLLTAAHCLFWKLFDWPASLAGTTVENAAIIQVLDVHVAFTLLFLTGMSLGRRDELLGTPLGRCLARFIAAFYALRLVNQVIFFDLGDGRSLIVIALCLAMIAFYAVPLYLTRRGAVAAAV